MTRTKLTEPSPATTIPAIPKQDVLGRLAALKTASTADLKDQWRAMFGAEPPAYSRRFLESRLAYKLQELAYGSLKPETVAHLESLGNQIDGKNITLRRTRQHQRPLVGTRLVREWQGVEQVVTVTRDGFEWQGRPYQSLSSVARAISGTRWNGWTFFGLRARGDA
jgi:Protein of unknown function (DUF2924)